MLVLEVGRGELAIQFRLCPTNREADPGEHVVAATVSNCDRYTTWTIKTYAIA